MYVKDIMFNDITSVGPNTDIKYLIKLLMRQHRDLMPVANQHNEYLGMIGIEDVIYNALPNYYKLISNINFMPPSSDKLIESLQNVKDKIVKDIFRKETFTLNEQDTALHAANLMIKEDLKTIAVIRDKKLVGLVNRADFLSFLIDQSL